MKVLLKLTLVLVAVAAMMSVLKPSKSAIDHAALKAPSNAIILAGGEGGL